MKLLGPTLFRVPLTEQQHEVGCEAGLFLRRGGVAGARAVEDGGGFGIRAEIGVGVLDAVVGETAAQRVEEIVALFEGVHKSLVAPDARVTGGFQACHPGIESLGQVDVERLVGTKSREDPGSEPRGGDGLVRGQVVGGIVGGADGPHFELREDAVDAQLIGRQQFAGAVPDALRAGFVQQLVDAEVAFQLQVGPVVERVAQGVGNGARPGAELLLGRDVAGAIGFVDAVGAHGAPLVVVALQPDFEEVAEAAVGGHVLRRDVAVVVQNRLVFGVFVVEPARGLRGEQEIFVDEGHSEPRLKHTAGRGGAGAGSG